MKSKLLYLLLIITLCWSNQSRADRSAVFAPPSAKLDTLSFENPFSVSYVETNMRKSTPRLILTPTIERNLLKKIKTDPVVKNYYQAIKLNAEQIQAEPLLTRKMTGRRLLSVSREMLYRMGVLGIVYRVEKDQEVLDRINEEVKAVCDFSDWNPSHFLDVAEMAMAVALAIDWAGQDLPQSTMDLALSALIEKGIKPSYPEKGEPNWIKGTNNWNQVCNGGMIAAAIMIAEKDPELAARTISRSLEGIPYALEEYRPDGLYPEGPTYWSYGTSFSVMTSSMLGSAFGKDFGLANFPGFQESAVFRMLMEAPSGLYYNFADSGDEPGDNGDVTLAWFAKETGDPLYLEREKFLRAPKAMGKLNRLAGPGLIWLSQLEAKQATKLPLTWKGEGGNPVVIFRGGDADPRQFYFGGKGGKATVSHGNMDAGSFVFELDGVRWVVDPGNQSYNELEKTGFNLWSSCQECERWTLLTKNNFGHSTLTVNGELHVNSGFAPLIDYKSAEKPEATFDLSAVFGENLDSVRRKFIKENDRSLLIEDEIKVNDATQNIVWQLMTTADVEVVQEGAILRNGRKMLKLEILSHPELEVSLVSLYPAPMKLDKQIKGLKRLEIRIPASTLNKGGDTIRVRLVGN